jgi:hypothetical protein
MLASTTTVQYDWVVGSIGKVCSNERPNMNVSVTPSMVTVTVLLSAGPS